MAFDWFAWWNAIYTVPLAVVVVFLAVTSLVSVVGGGLGDHDASAGHDAHDVGPDVGHDVGHEHDVHVGHDGQDHGHEAHGHHGGLLIAALAGLGAGKAPLALVLQVLFLLWGVIGVGLHQYFVGAGPFALLWSLPITLVASALGTRAFASLFGRYFKQYETAAVSRHEIVGKMGTVVYSVGEEAGTVNVRDEHGTLHRVRARSRHGDLDSGRQVIVVGYDPEHRVYQVDDAATFVDRP